MYLYLLKATNSKLRPQYTKLMICMCLGVLKKEITSISAGIKHLPSYEMGIKIFTSDCFSIKAVLCSFKIRRGFVKTRYHTI